MYNQLLQSIYPWLSMYMYRVVNHFKAISQMILNLSIFQICLTYMTYCIIETGTRTVWYTFFFSQSPAA